MGIQTIKRMPTEYKKITLYFYYALLIFFVGLGIYCTVYAVIRFFVNY